MKVNIEIDCTPEEARQFMGLPDVQPMQNAMMDKLQQKMSENIEKFSPEAILQNLIAVATSDGAMAATPLTSFGLSGSVGSAAMRSHSTRSADCACAAECSDNANKTVANEAAPDRRMIQSL